MKIVAAQTFIIEIPFDFVASGIGIMPTPWRSLEFALIRLEDELGNIGWGEGFGYFTVDATKAIVDRLLVPRLVGADIDDIPAWSQQTQLDLHLFGRYGITMFAISGVDLALWDLQAKRSGRPLYAELGAAAPRDLSCYASLMRYDDPVLAAAACVQAVERGGYTSLKLHETDLEVIAACRAAIGAEVPLAVDVNCQLQEDTGPAFVAALGELGVAWLEEPAFPPEDLTALTHFRSSTVPIASGENWCTATQFAASVGSVDIWQPSVTKVGGICEYLQILTIAEQQQIPVVPHSPYFGPGFYATIHLATAAPIMRDIEILWTAPDAWLTNIASLRTRDVLRAPTEPGLGFTPDPQVLERYRRA